jgi:hypothetical protein
MLLIKEVVLERDDRKVSARLVSKNDYIMAPFDAG